MALYADIVLPMAQPPFTFSVPASLEEGLQEGMCVEVQLGPRKRYTGLVWRLHGEVPPFRTVRPVYRVLYPEVIVDGERRRFWAWLADYYMCSLGEVMRAALPSALKPSGLTEETFSGSRFRPRQEEFVGLASEITDEAGLNACFDALKRAPRQYEAFMELCAKLPSDALFTAEVPRTVLAAEKTLLNKLVVRGMIRVERREMAAGVAGTLPADGRLPRPELTPLQQERCGQIESLMRDKDTVLLHGVTGSGKTEIYLTLIAEALDRGESVLYLLPEIALTAQLEERIRTYFGDRLTTYHSRITDRQRGSIYMRLLGSTGGELVLGVRSALFLPLPRLSLIVVDEEHDASFKQSDPAPRYHARDCAAVLARMTGARCLLGSATPSIESYVNAKNGKYGYVTLPERYGSGCLPQITVSDTLRAVKRGERNSHFNKDMLDKMEEALQAGRQVMLFQNRRGFSPYVECDDCGWAAQCPHCNVTLTLHKGAGELRCHYCGYRTPVPPRCPSCKSGQPAPKGFGTEKVEEELERLFPAARIARLDRDTAQSPRSYERIIDDFARRRTDILVGTQMITKGFDFSGVSLVGVLNADNLLNYPDFRVGERAFQLLTQVAGRAGRDDDAGEVVIQTSQPQHPVIRFVVEDDYEGMVSSQLAERSIFLYPPYGRLIALTLRHSDRDLLWRGAETLAAALRKVFGRRVLGPEAPPVDRIRGECLVSMMLKIEHGQSFAEARSLLAGELRSLAADKRYKAIIVSCNVDPQ